MKHIIAYIKPNKLPAVTLALHRLRDLSGMSFGDVRGFSSDRPRKSEPSIVQELVDYAPYVRVEVFCEDEQAYEVKWTIQTAACTGHNGDGKIFISSVCQVLHIQTGESVQAAGGGSDGIRAERSAGVV